MTNIAIKNLTWLKIFLWDEALDAKDCPKKSTSFNKHHNCRNKWFININSGWCSIPGLRVWKGKQTLQSSLSQSWLWCLKLFIIIKRHPNYMQGSPEGNYRNSFVYELTHGEFWFDWFAWYFCCKYGFVKLFYTFVKPMMKNVIQVLMICDYFKMSCRGFAKVIFPFNFCLEALSVFLLN